MKNRTWYHSQFFYETENIPDHRSRRFGCCASLLERIKTAFSKAKSRIRAATRTRRMQNEPRIKKSVLPFHHIMAAFAKQAGKGSSQKSTPIYEEDCYEKGNLV